MPTKPDKPVVLDTHAWLWWESSPSRLGRAGRARIESAATIGVAAISAWEVAMLDARGRISLDRPVLGWIRQALGTPRVRLHPLSPEIAVAAATLSGMGGDPADRMIYATAVAADATLISKDRRLTAFDRSRPPAERLVRW